MGVNISQINTCDNCGKTHTESISRDVMRPVEVQGWLTVKARARRGEGLGLMRYGILCPSCASQYLSEREVLDERYTAGHRYGKGRPQEGCA